MSTQSGGPPSEPAKHRPFVPETMQMREFTLRAVLIGLVMTVVLGAANAYLGLRAGITIAATYPAAVIGMAVLRAWKGSVLEENIARTAGSIGESVAAGAIFTLPAFLLSGAWASFGLKDYWKATALLMVGSILGVLFISLVRRVMVEDPELVFPESVAASEIHKAGQRGAQAAKYLFWNIGIGGVVYILGKFGLFAADQDIHFAVGNLGHSQVRLGTTATANALPVGGASVVAAPSVSPAYLGVGYIIGLRLASLQFAGSVLAWGLMVPFFMYFLGPQLKSFIPADTPDDWATMAAAVWRFVVRPIAVGGMLVGAAYTLFKMRASLTSGIGKAFADLRQTAAQRAQLSRTEQYMGSKTVFGLIAVMFVLMCFLYVHVSGLLWPAILAAVVMIIVGFFFATVSGNLVGFIGSSNNPISGLTLSTLLIAALLMVALGVSGTSGVAAVVCVSSAVAGELLQDFKVGYILGGTPRKIQIAELIAVVVASLVMYLPIMLLYRANIRSGGIGFGDRQLSAPQAGLMATLAQGIVGHNMPWPLVVVGVFFGIALIMMQVKSPMLVAVGMYLPFETTFAIFVGGVFRSLGDWVAKRRGFNGAQMARVENAGILTSSGLIAGEAILGLLWAGLQFAPQWMTAWVGPDGQKYPIIFHHPSYLIGGMVVLAGLAGLMIFLPITAAGDPNEPAPPTAIM